MDLAEETSRWLRGREAARRRMSLFSKRVLWDSLVRLSPIALFSNPVMLLVEITFFIVAVMAVYPQGFLGVASPSERLFYVEGAAILLITVWFSTLSDSLAERQAQETRSQPGKTGRGGPARRLATG